MQTYERRRAGICEVQRGLHCSAILVKSLQILPIRKTCLIKCQDSSTLTVLNQWLGTVTGWTDLEVSAVLASPVYGSWKWSATAGHSHRGAF